MLTSLDYKSELEILNENKKVCDENDKVLELQMMIVSALVKDDNTNDNLLRLQTKVNDRYFINQEMINVLNYDMDKVIASALKTAESEGLLNE